MRHGAVPASPPGWYEDPYEYGVYRYYDGARWTEDATVDPPTAPSSAAPESAAPQSAAPQSAAPQSAASEPLVGPASAGPQQAPDAVSDTDWVTFQEAGPSAPQAPSSPRPRWLRLALTVAGIVVTREAMVAAALLVPGRPAVYAGLLVALVPALVLAPLVSYRRRDAFALLVPFLGLYWYAKWAWRASYLPYRGWAPRPDEAADWVRLRHPRHADEVLYVPKQRLAKYHATAPVRAGSAEDGSDPGR